MIDDDDDDYRLSMFFFLTRVCWCISLHVRLDCFVSYVVS